MSTVPPTNHYTISISSITANKMRTAPIPNPFQTVQPNTSTELRLPLKKPRRNESKSHPAHLPLKPLNPPTTSLTNSKKENPIPSTAKSTTSDVLHLFDSLRLPIAADTYASLIKECTDARDAIGASYLHTHIISSTGNGDPISSSPFLNYRLLLMHVSCGCFDLARQVFDGMSSQRNLITWAIMITGFMHNGYHGEAVNFFLGMLHYHGNLNSFPPWFILYVLKACVHTLNLELGMQVHGWLVKAGHSSNSFLNSSLVNFYGKCRNLSSAGIVLNHIHRQGLDTVVWTAAIVNNCREKHFGEVLDAFSEMGRARIRKNSYTFSTVLRACGRMRDVGSGRQVHADAIKHGVYSNTFVQCGLVDMYGRCGLVKDAERVFDTLSDRKNVACWNAMLSGYTCNGFHIKALKFVCLMKAAGIEPQESLLNEVRVVCGSETC